MPILLGFAAGSVAAQANGGGPETESQARYGSGVLLASPGADTIAVLRPVARPEIVDSLDGWVRVRVEGWLAGIDAVDVSRAPADLGLSAIRAAPEEHVGATVRWRVQHLGLQFADSLRGDMPEGAPYLLARDPGGEPGFVYLLVPDGLVQAATGLAPLQRFEAVARLRVGSSPLTGHPILDLLELRP